MKSTLTLYQVCSDPPGDLPFDPMGNLAHLTKREALADLQDNRRHTLSVGGKTPSPFDEGVFFPRPGPGFRQLCGESHLYARP